MACMYTTLLNRVADRTSLFDTAPKVSLHTSKDILFLICLHRYYLYSKAVLMMMMVKLVNWYVYRCSTCSMHFQGRSVVIFVYKYFVSLLTVRLAEPVQRLYPEILKRLDDSNNTVRATSCGTMISFLRAVANKNDMKGTMIQYTLDCLFLHLDDSEMEIQVYTSIFIIF